jgi:uncharacterized protein (TIGR03000 family)
MYTIVLAAFLTTGNEIPDFGRRGGCHGCRGGWSGCYGCWGGCYGGWGGCFGCGGGCFGCYGGCFGCYGCGGGCFGCSGGCFGCYGCGGGCGGMGVVPAGGRPAPASAAAGGGGSMQMLQDLKRSVEELKNEQNRLRRAVEELKRAREAAIPPTQSRPELPDPQRGKVLLQMPADALIVVNDKYIDSTSAYLTPPLEAGKKQVVNVEAAVVRDGKSINRVKRLTIRSGEVVRLAYKDMEPDGRWSKAGETASAPAHITVRLPADARLIVHGVACPLTSDTRSFDTPALASGQKYYYLLKAEVVRNGRSIAQTRRVDFRSGEQVTVSFDNLGAGLVTAR